MGTAVHFYSDGNVVFIGNLEMERDIVTAILSFTEGAGVIGDVLQCSLDRVALDYDVFLKIRDVIAPEVLGNIDVSVNG
jgi:hypothetical protein